LTGSGADGTNDFGIWSNASGPFQLVARQGDSAPGVPGKVLGSIGEIMQNDAGQVAFQGYLTNPGVIFDWNYRDIDGLWAQDKAGIFHLVVRKGGQIEVAPGDFRTVQDYWYVRGDISGLNGDGSAFAFNARGQFTFTAYFTDNTSGVFVSDVATVPEPSSVALVTSIVIALVASQCRVRSRLGPQPGSA
jgi:hypothetical protein